MDGQVGGPLPWEGEERFESIQADCGTPLLMGAYRATLPDPILNEGYNIGLAADMLAGTVLQPGEVFSQNKKLAPYSREKGFREGPMYKGSQIVPSIGGGVCKIASLLYNVTVLSNLKVVERHPHSMTVPYVPPGQDATVATGARDYRFKNTSSGPVLIWARKVGHTLYMAFYGRDKPPRVTWEHETLKTIPYTTKVSFNPRLAAGEERVVIDGSDGLVVRSWLVITGEDGTVTRRDLGKDYYNPCPRVIERGAKRER
ncbi:MAG: hypothetical protein HPY50_18350 [Firmicutes bacterium]|nr:hypothetical protein [Bacillota bacterium]